MSTKRIDRERYIRADDELCEEGCDITCPIDDCVRYDWVGYLVYILYIGLEYMLD